MNFYTPYVPILIFIGVAFFFAFVIISLAYIRSKRNPYKDKVATYECGFDSFDTPENNTRRRFDVQFYLIAILFIIFDVEIVLLFPWAASFHKIGFFGYISMMIFLFVLTLGFIYEWRKGALDWE